MSTHTNNVFATDIAKPNANKPLHIGLWVAQVLLAAVFTMAGILKTTTPLPELVLKLPYVADIPNLIRFIGGVELLGAIGLILPALTRIKPKLTALAAAGLTTVMVLALFFHISRGEFAQAAPINITLGALAAFVAWGRSKKAPIRARVDH